MSHMIMSLRGGAGHIAKAKPPVVTSIAPATGTHLGGTPVVITGKNFKKSANPHCAIAGVACTAFVVINSTTIHCTTGAHAIAAAQNVVVTNDDTGDGYGMIGTGVGLYGFT